MTVVDLFASVRGPMEQRPWALAPLLEATGSQSIAALALRTGMSRPVLSRAQRSGLTDHQADVAALALGLHPAQIWNEW